MKEAGGALNPLAPEVVAGLLPHGVRVLDIGCGEGRLLKYLENNGCLPVGAEPDTVRALKARQSCPHSKIVNAQAEALPFPAESFDVAVMECTFSLCDAKAAVKELYRILVPGGTVVITDLYTRAEQAVLEKSHMVQNIYPKNVLEAFFGGYFILTSFEDHSHELAEMFAQMILDDTVCGCVAPEELAALRLLRPGYGIWLWMKL